jgi:hypothetical protein
MKNHTILFVSPVQRIASQGRDRQVFTIIDPKTKQLTTTRAMNKTREVGTSVTLKFPLDVHTGRYVTGLDELIPNPIYQMDPETVFSTYSLSPKWQDIITKTVKQEQISRQLYFEILDNVDPDYYNTQAKVTMMNFQPSQLLNREASFIEKFRANVEPSDLSFNPLEVFSSGSKLYKGKIQNSTFDLQKKKKKIRKQRNKFYSYIWLDIARL